MNSQYKRDLPTPGSPTIATTWPCPPRTRCSASCNAASSRSRPTNPVSPRLAATWSRDRPGVQADTNLDETSLGLPNSLRVALDRFLHSERCITSPYRMVLMSDGRPEERHNPITHHLVDRALVAVDRLHHEFEHRVQDLARLLGVPVGEQLHGALYVGEEHGDLLALAFQGGPGGEDVLGQVLRGVR